MTDQDLNRYIRQIRFPGMGESAQRKLQESRVLLVGCGALGSVIANTLVRAGIGLIRIVDRDYLELNNLQRQVLYDESDVEGGLPKAVVAAEKLRAINSDVVIEPVVADVTFENVEGLATDVDLLMDGTDNFEIRFLLNDVSQKHEIPWVYGGCLGADGQTMTIVPGKTPCLACLMSEGPPSPGSTPTCDSAGILGPIINIIASLQCTEAIKILSGNGEQISRCLNVVEVWDNRFRQLSLDSLQEQDCPVCKNGVYEFLNGGRGSQSAVLCGRNSVQLSFAGETLDLEALESELEKMGKVQRNPFLLRFEIDQYQITLFPDARAIISGTDDVATARSLYAKHVGN
ncbi:MAG: ThiF family adenylyltransferase [Pirellulaceae bacterium]|nr:ThiF family adenylyltransferase [Pirellulaceae bacterium]